MNYNEYNELEQNQEQIKSRHSTYIDRVNKCAYEALEKNEYGKELMSHLTKKLYQQIGPGNNSEYYAGQQDMVRSIMGLIEDYKRNGK